MSRAGGNITDKRMPESHRGHSLVRIEDGAICFKLLAVCAHLPGCHQVRIVAATSQGHAGSGIDTIRSPGLGAEGAGIGLQFSA